MLIESTSSGIRANITSSLSLRPVHVSWKIKCSISFGDYDSIRPNQTWNFLTNHAYMYTSIILKWQSCCYWDQDLSLSLSIGLFQTWLGWVLAWGSIPYHLLEGHQTESNVPGGVPNGNILFIFFILLSDGAGSAYMITILMIYDGDTALPGDGLCYKTTS